MFGVLSRITHIYKQNLFNPALRDQISSTKVPRLIYEIRSDPITRIFRKLSFTMMKDDLLIRQIEDHSVINISSCLIHTIPTFKWWTFYSENSDSCVRCCGEKRKKSYTTATSYRRATWPRFRRNKLICAYIYIPQWWSSCIGFVRAWIAANCTTDQCNRSQPCENGNFTRIYRLFDWPTYTSHLTSRNTVVHIHTHTHSPTKNARDAWNIFAIFKNRQSVAG